MKEAVTGATLFASIKMLSQTTSQLFLLVEGEDEARIFGPHVNSKDVLLLVAGGKPTVLNAMALVEKSGTAGVLGVVDSDNDEFTGRNASYPAGVVSTAGYDLMSDVVRALPGVLRQSAHSFSRSAALAVETAIDGTIDVVVRRLVQPVAAIRIVNSTEGLGLNLRGFPFAELIEANYGAPRISAVLEIANQRSITSASYAALAEKLDDAAAEIHSRPHLAVGHDLVDATAALLRHAGASQVGSRPLASAWISALTCSAIAGLAVCQRIARWAAEYGRTAFSCPSHVL